MRMAIAAVVATMTSVAMADDIADARRQAVAGRDSYWNCLARSYGRDGNGSLSGQDFTLLVAVLRKAEFSSDACKLPRAAIPRRRCGRPYDDGQQRHRIGPKRCRDGLYQAQGSVQVAPPKESFPIVYDALYVYSTGAIFRDISRSRGNRGRSRWTRRKWRASWVRLSRPWCW